MTREELRAKAIEAMTDGYETALHSDLNSSVEGCMSSALDALGAAGFKVFGPDVESINAGDLARKP